MASHQGNGDTSPQPARAALADCAMNRFEIGDCRTTLRAFPEETFDCCVTSPPYFGLRDYGHEPTIWGGNAGCEHRWSEDICSLCAAWRGCFGLEPSPDMYVEHAVEVFRAVRRTLKADATLWLNLGDSYANDSKWGGSSGGKHVEGLHGQTGIGRGRRVTGLKSKDLIGIPWRVAFALQADGWWLRSEIIWAKPNAMPESVSDRPTKAHEHVFLLTKSQNYHYDEEAIQEKSAGRGPGNSPNNKHEAAYRAGDEKLRTRANLSKIGARSARSARSVWTVATEPYAGSHFAVMPSALAARCILAGCPAGGIVLDPFFGSGTVGSVAEQLGRKWFGCEINQSYSALIAKRTAQVGLFK